MAGNSEDNAGVALCNPEGEEVQMTDSTGKDTHSLDPDGSEGRQ